MTSDLETAVRKAQQQLTEASDTYHRYKKLYLQWQDEVNVCQRVLNRLREAAGLAEPGYAADDDQRETLRSRAAAEERDETPVAAVMAEAIPAQTVKAAVAAPHSVAVGPNGFDRIAARRHLRRWHMRYPLAKSYQHLSQMIRQAQTAELCDHRDYKEKWLDGGGMPLADTGATMGMVEDCAEHLGVDLAAIAEFVSMVHGDILNRGVRGVDYAVYA